MALERKHLWWIGGAVFLAVAVWKRRPIAAAAGKALDATKRTALRAIVPAKGEEFVDLAFEIAPKYGFSPTFVLAFLAVESGFRLRPNETGDFIPRCVAGRGARSGQLPGVVVKWGKNYKGIECEAYVPTTQGWGLGPMQIDWDSHPAFYARGDVFSARAQMDYAVGTILRNDLTRIKAAFPNMSKLDQFRTLIAAYNAGAGGAISAVKRGTPLESITAKDWYIPRIAEYMGKLDKIFGIDSEAFT